MGRHATEVAVKLCRPQGLMRLSDGVEASISITAKIVKSDLYFALVNLWRLRFNH
jgi:hypothetical protein